MIRPHLEYAAQVWNPRLLGDIERLDRKSTAKCYQNPNKAK